MELPWQPNLGKNNAKLHKFQICFVNVFGVHQFKYAIRIFKGAKGVAMQPNLDKNTPKLQILVLYKI